MNRILINTRYFVRERFYNTSSLSIPYNEETYQEALERTKDYIDDFLDCNRKELSITITEN